MADLSKVTIDGQQYSLKDDYSRTNKVDKVANKELMPSDLLDANGNVSLSHLPDIVLGQMIYGGTVNASNVATLSTNAKTKLSTTSNTITLTNNTASITGYVANEGIYYIATGNATLANLGVKTGDWLLSTGSAWKKIDNTDEVSSVNGKTGAVTLNANDVGAVSTTANQGLSDTEKANARTNIGAATSTQGTKADSAVQTIQMNGSSVTKTDGVVNLGTVITAHQDISGKADKNATVSNVTYDTTNKKLTKTINGATSDVVTTAKLKTDMALTKSDVGLDNVGNFKAVSTAASQGLSDTEKSNARTNIGLDSLGYYGIGGRTTNTTTNPWVLVAETTALNNNNTGITLLFDYTFTETNNATSTGTGILSVSVRTNANGAIITGRSYAKWLTKMNELNDDDVVVTYTNSTKSLQIWAKSDYAYKIFRVRPLSGSNRFNLFDVSKWTFTAALNTNMYESYPTGDGITVLTPTCDIALFKDENNDITTNDDTRNIKLEGSNRVDITTYGSSKIQAMNTLELGTGTTSNPGKIIIGAVDTSGADAITIQEDSSGNGITINKDDIQLNAGSGNVSSGVTPGKVEINAINNNTGIELNATSDTGLASSTMLSMGGKSFALTQTDDLYKIEYDSGNLMQIISSGTLIIEAGTQSGPVYDTTWVQLGTRYMNSPSGISIRGVSIPYANNAGFHNSIYRGENLGTSYTSAQKAQVQAGTFDDLFVGDYWTINGINWRIAHCDYYLNTGDTATTKHHLVIVPDTSLANSYMNATNITTGAYAGSYMNTTTLLQDGTEASDSVFGKIKAAFDESNLLSIHQMFANAVDSDGNVSGWTWYSTRCFLMNQCMVYGNKAWANGNNDGYNVGVDKSQLALFAHNPTSINTRQTYWLRDVRSSTSFAVVYTNGNATNYTAASVFGVRPVFILS